MCRVREFVYAFQTPLLTKINPGNAKHGTPTECDFWALVAINISLLRSELIA